jgi:L-seryl-tRNA(Ser) seleniumtransferase
MFRALRVDKLICGALETTLRDILLENWDNVPAMRMITLSAEEIRIRAIAVAERIPGATVIEGRSVIGGGSTPNQSLATWLISMPGAKDVRLREHTPPIIARVEDGCTLLDLRTVFVEEEDILVEALQS